MITVIIIFVVQNFVELNYFFILKYTQGCVIRQ